MSRTSKYTQQERFWRNINKTRACWLWKLAPVTRGYGLFRLASVPTRRQIGAHRYSWILHNGPIPDGLQVCHKCDVPACVRPSHLFLGTQQENIADMFSKRRAWTQQYVGPRKSGSHKLSKNAIRAIAASNTGATALAKSYGVSRTTIYNIRHKKLEVACYEQ